jgi:hypothetical protein
LVPIPRGESLRVISTEMLARIDRVAAEQRDVDGKTRLERFQEEQPMMLPVLSVGFEPAKVVPCSVSRSALVKLNGATYSVPSHWQGLEATAYIGADSVRIVLRDESVTFERQGFGRKVVRYEHYLAELARKPQAVRQVAAELLAELDEPYGALWRLLVDTHGPREAARAFARVLGAIVDHGRDRVARAVESALLADRTDLLDLARELSVPRRQTVTVPASLSGYDIEAASAADYDALLAGAER